MQALTVRSLKITAVKPDQGKPQLQLNMVKSSSEQGPRNKPHLVQTEQHTGATLQNAFHWQAQNQLA